MTDLTDLEKAVLDAALVDNAMSQITPGENARMAAAFRAQAKVAKATVRTPSGVGFVTKLKVPDELCVPESGDCSALPTVCGEHPELPSGAEFVLQIKNGRLNSIEAFCFEGMWPGDESLFRVVQKL